MKPQIKYGVVEIFVLAILTHGESYGYKLVSDLQEHISITESTLYPILRRLEVDKAIVSRNEIFNGRNRKYFTITGNGLDRIRDFMRDLEDIRRISFILEEGKFYGKKNNN